MTNVHIQETMQPPIREQKHEGVNSLYYGRKELQRFSYYPGEYIPYSFVLLNKHH